MESKILYVIVIYGITIEQSTAYQSLHRILPLETFSSDVYIHDNTINNIYLAKAYNKALDYAKEHGYQWMILLDDDATITNEYIDAIKEVVKRNVCTSVWAPVLKNSKGKQLSPHSLYGIHVAFNSGMLLPISILEKIGGFNNNYPLDYLDYRLCYDLQLNNIPLRSLSVTMVHNLSVEDRFQVSRERYLSILNGERRFADETGHTIRYLCVLTCRLIKRAIFHDPYVKETYSALISKNYLLTDNEH